MAGMKRLLPLFLMIWALALAARPAYPETAVQAGYSYPQGGYLGAALALERPVLGLDAGVGLDLAYRQNLAGALEGQLLVFPTLTFMKHFASVGGFFRLPFGYDRTNGFGLGLALGPRASLELGDVTLSAEAGLGYYRGLFLAYGLGARAYFDAFGLELDLDNALGAPGARLSLLYLF